MKPIIIPQNRIQSLLDGSMTQYRFPVKPQPPTERHTLCRLIDSTDRDKTKHIGKHHWAIVDGLNISSEQGIYFNPPYKPGDKLWVREIWWKNPSYHNEYGYKADIPEIIKPTPNSSWRSPVTMPKKAARIFLKVKNVSIEKVQDISEEDAKAEGIAESETVEMADGLPCYTIPFYDLWVSTYGIDNPNAWESNPFVWKIEFDKETK